MTAELRERLEQLVRPYHLSDWELEEYADVVGELPAEARRRVLDLVPSIWPVSHALTFSFLRNAARGLATFGETRLQIWVGAILEAIRAGHVRSAHDCSEGGLAVALAESCIADETSPLGAEIDLSSWATLSRRALLFGETQGRIVVSTADADAVTAIATRHGVPVRRIGTVRAAADGLSLQFGTARWTAPLDQLADAYHGAIPRAMSRAAAEAVVTEGAA